MTEATSGNADISWGDEVLYAMVEKNLKIFEKMLDIFIKGVYNSYC